jgi:hypothetical protein
MGAVFGFKDRMLFFAALGRRRRPGDAAVQET